MDTQNTPIHIKLWHRDFWRLCFANLLLMTSVYMLLLAVPYYMLSEGYRPWHIGCVMGAYGLGIFLFGGFCSYLVQRYRRNRVCQLSIMGVVACLFVLYYLEAFWQIKFGFMVFVVSRLLLGAFLGLAQMTLASTLIIDTCESFQRTEANYITSWFARFSMATGPLAAILVCYLAGEKFLFPAASCLALVSLVLVSRAKFPFKAPAEHLPLVSCDRFFLPQGFPLFLNLVGILFSAGIYFSIAHDAGIFLMILGGLVLALVAEKFVFADANLKSEALAGMILLGAAQLVDFSDQDFAHEVVVPLLFGLALGVIGSRFLLFYIKLAKHCQRGTSMSSFFLAWELGLSLGIGVGYILQDKVYAPFNLDTPIYNTLYPSLLYVALGTTAVCLLAYNFIVHPWYMKHRNR